MAWSSQCYLLIAWIPLGLGLPPALFMWAPSFDYYWNCNCLCTSFFHLCVLFSAMVYFTLASLTIMSLFSRNLSKCLSHQNYSFLIAGTVKFYSKNNNNNKNQQVFAFSKNSVGRGCKCICTLYHLNPSSNQTFSKIIFYYKYFYNLFYKNTEHQ